MLLRLPAPSSLAAGVAPPPFDAAAMPTARARDVI